MKTTAVPLQPLWAGALALALAACGGGSSGGGGSSSSAQPTLVALSSVPAGAVCAYGGRQVDFGPDRNGNGTLDSDEVGGSLHGCNGAPGPAGSPGATTLVGLSPEAAGPNCTYGGNKVSFGLDSDGDAVLDPAEVTGSAFSCNGATGAAGAAGPAGPAGPAGAPGLAGVAGLNGLTVLTPEPAGANCTAGGSRIDAGLDANRNGLLDAGEVALTDYICNGATGATGAAGPAGPAGPQGPAGANGLNSLSLVTAEPAGANCAAGGSKIRSGLDANGNSVLDAGEVTSTVYACNGLTGATGATGAAGAAGLDSILSTTAEPAGANCATGGSRLTAGLDTNRNGTLDAAEVTGTSYTCNGAAGPQGPAGPVGANGFNSILNSIAEPAGANCPTGGRKLTFGLDTNRDGTLDAAEVAGTSYVCNGAQGPAGPTGAQGPTGPQGPAGSLNVYGDGSGGAFVLPFGQTLDLTTVAGYNALLGRQHLQFTSISIAGSLVVPSGTVLRATGDVTIASTGTIEVATGARDSGNGAPHPGVSLAAPGSMQGGIGLSALSAAQLTRPPAAAGGAGERLSATSGGEGGGSLVILARGNFNLYAGGSILALGANGLNPGVTSDIAGGGGGGGGIVVIGAKSGLTVAGVIRAAGGRGADGVNGNGGTQGAGAGGGGGGGIVHLVSSSAPAITGSVNVAGGAPGTDAPATNNLAGGGGGACGGNGGNGGGNLVFGGPFTAAQAGGAGYALTTVVPEPENLFIQ